MMKRGVGFILLVWVILATPAFARDKVDLLDESLKIARVVHPEIDPAVYKAKVEQLLSELRPLLVAGKSPDDKIETVNNFIFKKHHAKVNPMSSNSSANPQNAQEESLLSHVLDTWEGNCLGFTTLYLIVGDALNMPVAPVLAPGHIFVQYNNGAFKRNIETTADGENLSEDEMARQLRVTLTPAHRALGTYFRPSGVNDVMSSIYANAGLILATKGKVEKALHFYDQAQKLNPKNGEVHIDRALTFIGLKQYGEALAESNEALKLLPEAAQAYLNKGLSLHKLGRPVDAIEAYQRAILLRPAFAPAYYDLGNILGEHGRVDEAIANYSKAIENNRAYSKAYFNRGTLYLEEKHQAAKAVADFSEVLKFDAANHEVYFARGLAYQELGDRPKASADLQRYMKLEPSAAEKRGVGEMVRH